MAEVLVVVSKVKKMVKDAGFRTGGDYVEALSGKINAIEGMTVKSVCKSKTRELWYVLIELNRHRHPDIEAAFQLLEQKNIKFKQIDRPESEFSNLCNL